MSNGSFALLLCEKKERLQIERMEKENAMNAEGNHILFL